MPDPSLEPSRNFRTNGRLIPMPGAGVADPHGHAALLLVESLLHTLVDKSVISRGEAIDIVDIAAEVEQAMACSADGTGASDASLLAPLAKTFRIDGA